MRRLVFICLAAVFAASFAEAGGMFPNPELKMVFMIHCAECHGRKGEGSDQGPALRGSGYLKKIGKEAMIQIIADGVAPDKRRLKGKFPEKMPKYADEFSKQDMDALATVIESWNK